MRTHAKALVSVRVLRTWLVGLLLLALPVAARAQVVLQHGFEDGTTQGWFARGGTIAVVSEAAASGVYSLKQTGRTAAWNGPGLMLTTLLEKDTPYEFSAAVRLTTGQPATTLKMTMARVPLGGSAAYEEIAPSASVTDAAWVTLRGTYRFSGDVDSLMLYVESASETADYYLDDVRISRVVPDQSGFLSDFEDGTLLGYTTPGGTPRYWAGRGPTVVTNVADTAQSGARSLLASGRTSSWNGPSIDILGKMTNGFRYRITTWVKLADGSPDTNLRVSIQRTLAGATSYQTVIPNTLVTAGQWTRLTALFTMTSDADSLSIYVETNETGSGPMVSFYIDDFELRDAPPPPVQTDIPKLKDELAGFFLFGGAIEPAEASSPRHVELMKLHLNSLTCGNAMKVGPIHPAEATYSFANADAIANFARANGMTMRGHTLVWHSQNPDWLFKDDAGVDLLPTPENKALMLKRLEDHIRTVVARYDDVVSSWDVVNEVIDPNEPDGLRRSKWYELTGTDYIDTAFRVAREVAGPEVKLYINDYSTTDPAKLAALKNVVQGLLRGEFRSTASATRCTSTSSTPSIASIGEAIQTFAAMGLDNQITEMDVSLYTNSTDSLTVIPPELFVRQGYRYRDIFKELRRLGDSISSVTLWGIADDNTWLKTFPIARLDLPLLFDEDLQAKPAYWGVVDPQQLPVLIQELNVVEGSARVDGRRDLVWTTAGATPIDAGEAVSASFKLLWDERHLYLTADVADATPNRDDSVEVFVDENNGKTTTYEEDDAQYTFQRFGVGRHGHGRRHRCQPVRFHVRALPGGYRVEAAIRLERALAVGDELGFDIRVKDADTGAVVSWNDFTLGQETDTSEFGTLRLVGGNQIEGVMRGTPVVDGVEDPVWAWATELHHRNLGARLGWGHRAGEDSVGRRAPLRAGPGHGPSAQQGERQRLGAGFRRDFPGPEQRQDEPLRAGRRPVPRELRERPELRRCGFSREDRERDDRGAGRLPRRGRDRARQRRCPPGRGHRVRRPGERRRAGRRRAQRRRDVERPDRRVVAEHVALRSAAPGVQEAASTGARSALSRIARSPHHDDRPGGPPTARHRPSSVTRLLAQRRWEHHGESVLAIAGDLRSRVRQGTA